MGRPKGSKNKAKHAIPKTEATVGEQIAAVKAEMEALSAGVDELSAKIREKKRRINAAKKELSRLLLLEEQFKRAKEDAKRQEQAKQIADAFLASGKKVEDILPLLEIKAEAN